MIVSTEGNCAGHPRRAKGGGKMKDHTKDRTTQQLHRHHSLRALLRTGVIFVLLLILCGASVYAAGTSAQTKAAKILSKMSMNEKIAQMMMVSFPASDAVKIQKKNQFGGYLLFGRDFKNSTKKKMRAKLSSCQKVSKRDMLMAVDEEGGTVVRASLYSQFRKQKFRSPRAVYQAGGYSGIVSDTRAKDRFLKSLNINCNLAPVADVAYKKSNFIYSRSFSTKAGKTKKFIKLTVRQMGKDKVVSTLKHFPGYGGNGDTHGRIIRDRRSLNTFKTRDLKPFAAGIKEGTDMIMVSHTIVYAFDSKRPASLSKKVHRYIRKEMDYDGVLITDGLGMKGITDFVKGDAGEASVRAIQAGNDMLCVTGDYKQVLRALKKAVKQGRISEKQIDRSVTRILTMKLNRGIIR